MSSREESLFNRITANMKNWSPTTVAVNPKNQKHVKDVENEKYYNEDKVDISNIAKKLAIYSKCIELNETEIFKTNENSNYEVAANNRSEADEQSLWDFVKNEVVVMMAESGVKKALSVVIGKVFSGAIGNVIFNAEELNSGEEEWLQQRIENMCIECDACVSGDGTPSSCPTGVFDGSVFDR